MRCLGMDMRSSIEDTRKGFEESFASGEFYNRQTQDSDHMEKILRFVKIRGRMRILDLGCGSGYLAFMMANFDQGQKTESCKIKLLMVRAER
jgi:cyclopropane fatty-acyl-phospholipid synthase-like methyltransferase